MKIIDLHCDIMSKLIENNGNMLTNEFHFDINRALRTGLKVQFFSLFTHPNGADACLRNILLQLNMLLRALEQYPEHVYLLTRSEQIEKQDSTERLGAIVHLEGGEALGAEIELLYLLYRLGLRSLALTWNPPNLLAGGVDAAEETSGLTEKGRELIRYMDKIGVILDLAHIAPRSFFEALDCFSRPVMVTHANAFAICPHRRNLKDEQLKALAQNGGIMGFTLVSDFVKATGPVKPNDFMDHLVYVAELIGVEHLALGSDFDGADHIVLDGVEAYGKLPSLLEKRGFNQKEMELILFGNALRVIGQII